MPSSHLLTAAAKRREQRDSPDDSVVGERFTIMSVFPSPESEGCRRYVSLESRNGMWLDLLPMAVKTVVSAATSEARRERGVSL